MKKYPQLKRYIDRKDDEDEAAIFRQLPTEDVWFREEAVKHFYGFTDEIWAGLDDYERARKRVFHREYNLRKAYSEWVSRKHYENKKK